MRSTTVRIDADTHRQLKKLAADMEITVTDTVAMAVRRLRQDRMGADLCSDLTGAEAAWLDAELG
ncbi:hypothetical protein [Candidatus Poriferisodalis sp.]|uniref:hypothetical protein n=1 Tax=Candidatus Poriferisodalis sp. TaxID=3101277 RepID=UPI003B028E19